jgi:hypothetical protein
MSSHLALTVRQPRLVLHVATVLTVIESITGELRVTRQLAHLENDDRIIVRRHQRHRASREEVGRISDGSLTESPDHSAMAGEGSATYLPWTVARTRVQLTARWHKLHGGNTVFST